MTLNLPRLGYLAEGNDAHLFSLISERMEIVARAHTQKRQFIERLLAIGDGGPLALLSMDCAGSSYLKLDRATYLIGMVGLNELVQLHRGAQLHEDEKALKFGLKILGHIQKMAARLSRQHSMRFILEQTPAESTAYRFARLDLKYHSPRSGHLVRGDIARGEMYYTNSTQLNIAAKTDPFARVRSEGLFHPLIDGNAITSIWLGEVQTVRRGACPICDEGLSRNNEQPDRLLARIHGLFGLPADDARSQDSLPGLRLHPHRRDQPRRRVPHPHLPPEPGKGRRASRHLPARHLLMPVGKRAWAFD